MKKRMKKINFRKGIGEFTAFAIIAPLICLLILELCAFIQLTTASHDIANALDAAGRSATVCMSYDDAKEQAKRVAESAITNSNVHDVEIEVELANENDEWKTGTIIIVTLSAKVDTISFSTDPVFSSESVEGVVTKTMVYTVEGSNNSDLREAMIAYAVTFLGTPYVWGGNGMAPGEGLDCGQFVKAVYHHFGMDFSRSRIIETAIQNGYGREITLQEAKPGDILRWPGHIGIYFGEHKVIHATTTPTSEHAGGCVQISNIWPGYRVVNIIDHWNR